VRTYLFLLAAAALLNASDPRAKVTDYPAHAESTGVAIGAEYLVHSYGDGHQMLTAPDFLVVDTAVYPKGALVTIHESDFLLRITPQKGEPFLVPAQAPQFVGLGGAFQGLGTGGATQPRAPGDPGLGQPPIPQGTPNAAGEIEPESPSQVAVRTALPEGETRSGQAGFLFFPYSGKTKKLKGIDLIYKSAGGEVVVKLF
jgi:hypothetical protein